MRTLSSCAEQAESLCTPPPAGASKTSGPSNNDLIQGTRREHAELCSYHELRSRIASNMAAPGQMRSGTVRPETRTRACPPGTQTPRLLLVLSCCTPDHAEGAGSLPMHPVTSRADVGKCSSSHHVRNE